MDLAAKNGAQNLAKMRSLLWGNGCRRRFEIWPVAHAIPTAGCDLGAGSGPKWQPPNRSLLWGLHARTAKLKFGVEMRSPTVAPSFFPFLLCMCVFFHYHAFFIVFICVVFCPFLSFFVLSCPFLSFLVLFCLFIFVQEFFFVSN